MAFAARPPALHNAGWLSIEVRAAFVFGHLGPIPTHHPSFAEGLRIIYLYLMG